MVRVLLADNDPVMRAGLAVVVTHAGMAVTGQVNGGSELARAVMTGQPDVVVGDFDPITGVSQVARAVPGTAMLMFTARDDSESVRDAIKAGVRGYLHKVRPRRVCCGPSGRWPRAKSCSDRTSRPGCGPWRRAPCRT
nr:response regulator transcription factor [Kibdelosporangium sp. MJ126-NF4]